jgi:hypothetical protein
MASNRYPKDRNAKLEFKIRASNSKYLFDSHLFEIIAQAEIVVEKCDIGNSQSYVVEGKKTTKESDSCSEMSVKNKEAK